MTENHKEAPHHHQTPDEIKKICSNKDTGSVNGVRICQINEELQQGMTEMENYTESVTFYGSARFKEGDEYYDRARKLAYRISNELKHTVVTGGGPGIMEAGNRGAFEAGGKSVGLTIKLPTEQKDNPYLTDEIPFNFFFARKMSLSFSSEVFIFFPGGFGTLDECSEILTLIQTKKLEKVPIILYGSDFWGPIFQFFKTTMLEKFQTISEPDLSIFTITDDDDLVIDIVKNAKPRSVTGQV